MLGPILIICTVDEKEAWEQAIHRYTFLKVAILSGRLSFIIIHHWPYLLRGRWEIDDAALRKNQWQAYFGKRNEMVVGEYNVFILSSVSFKLRSSVDNAYFRELTPSLVIADSSSL